jgi:thioredoxin 1
MAKFSEIVTRDKPVLVDFHATWCGPCKMMEPVIAQLKESFGEKIAIVKIDIDKNQALATQLGVRGVPTFMLYKDGKMVWRESGARPKYELESVIKSHL